MTIEQDHITHRASQAADRLNRMHETDIVHGRELAQTYALVAELATQVVDLATDLLKRVEELERRSVTKPSVATKSLLRKLLAEFPPSGSVERFWWRKKQAAQQGDDQQ
jgi:hypothetical protein